MGMRPCDIHGTRYLGPSNHLYPAMVAGEDRVSRRWSCCMDCYMLVVNWAEVHLDQITMDTPVGRVEEIPYCPGCGEPVPENDVLLFLTAYKTHQPRRDFFGRAHAGCRVGLEAPLGITPLHWAQEPLPAA